MKYTTEEALSEILCRRKQLAIRRNRRACGVLSGLTGGLFALLVLVIALLPDKGAAISTGSVYGSFLLDQEAGGYVLAAVIAFVLGITVTLLSLRYRKHKHPDRMQTNDGEEAT